MPRALAEMVKRQVFSMRRQVDHYLSRARAAGSLDVLGNRTQVSAVLEDLSRVIARIHAARGIVIDAQCADDLYFRGERQDLEEMLGNLIDNACKWARRRVRVRCERTAAGWSDGSRMTGRACRPNSVPRWASGGNGWTKAYRGPGWGWPSCGIFPSFTGVFSAWTKVPWAGFWPGWNFRRSIKKSQGNRALRMPRLM